MTTLDAAPRRGYFIVAWVCNSLAILVGLWSILLYMSVISMVITAFYCLNIYVLLGDYRRWAQMKQYILWCLFALLGADLATLLIEYFFIYKAGYYEKQAYGTRGELLIVWFSFVFHVVFLLLSFLSTYYLYPDELSLLSAQHPAAVLLINPSRVAPSPSPNPNPDPNPNPKTAST